MAMPTIEPYAGPIEHNRGRALSPLMESLRNSLNESAESGQSRLWRGGASEWKLNTGRLRAAAQKLDLFVSVSIVGDDLAFKASKMRSAS